MQVTLTEIRPDGMEVRVQSGWHRPVHRDGGRRSAPTRCAVDYTFVARAPRAAGAGGVDPLPGALHAGGPRVPGRVAGCGVTMSTPGRDQPFWCFENPVAAGAGHDVGWGGEHASVLVLPVWDGVHEVAAAEAPEHPPADALRGQPARAARPIVNTAVD